MRDEEYRNPKNKRTSEKAREDQEETEEVIRTINVIARGFAGGGMTKSARKKHLQEVLSLPSEKMKKTHKLSSTPKIVFSGTDLEGIMLGHDNPMVILAMMVNAEVKKSYVPDFVVHYHHGEKIQ